MISCDLLVTGRFIYCYLLCRLIIFFTTAKIYLLSSSEYCQWNENQNTIHGLTHDINSMPQLLYTWHFEKFTASVTSSGHSALRHEVSRICTILNKDLSRSQESIFISQRCLFVVRKLPTLNLVGCCRYY